MPARSTRRDEVSTPHRHPAVHLYREALAFLPHIGEYVSMQSLRRIMPAASQYGNYGPLARVLKAVADPIRLAILDQVRDGERSVWDIANGVGAERSNVSRHLSVLAAAGVLTSRKDGVKVFYRLRTPCILSLFTCVCNVIEADVRESQAAVGHARKRGGK